MTGVRTDQRRPPGESALGADRVSDDEMVPRILDAAERPRGARPRLNVSIRDIAAEAGLPHSAIYRYFDGKDDVLRQVLARGRQRQLERDARSRDAGWRR